MHGTSNVSGVKSFLVNQSGGVEPYRLVKNVAPDTAGQKSVAYCGAGEESLAVGVTDHAADDGDPVGVVLLSEGRTVKVTASAAITLSSGRRDLVCATGGKVAAYSTGKARIAQTSQAASGDNSVIEAIASFAVVPSAIAGS